MKKIALAAFLAFVVFPLIIYSQTTNYTIREALNLILEKPNVAETEVIETVTVSGATIAPRDTLFFDIGRVDDCTQIFVKFLASVWQDSLEVQFGSSGNPGWDTGSTAFFDFNPNPSTPGIQHLYLSTAIGVYGVLIPLQDSRGAWIPGKHVVGMLINKNYVGDKDVTNLNIISLKARGR